MAVTVNKQEMSGRRLALREALVASAQRIISERGYQALRARDVAQDVGCALGAIYGVFADLDALVLAVKERTLDLLEGEITERLGPAETLRQDDPSAPRDAAERRLQRLAELYLAFASQHPRLWRAVFEHRSPDEIVPDTYMAKLESVLGYVERPLEVLAPELSSPKRQLWARALFSAIHGIVALGLDQKLGPLSAESLRWQVQTFVHAAAVGVAGGRPVSTT
jgi:AcrR family transcriptional regulator